MIGLLIVIPSETGLRVIVDDKPVAGMTMNALYVSNIVINANISQEDLLEILKNSENDVLNCQPFGGYNPRIVAIFFVNLVEEAIVNSPWTMRKCYKKIVDGLRERGNKIFQWMIFSIPSQGMKFNSFPSSYSIKPFSNLKGRYSSPALNRANWPVLKRGSVRSFKRG